MPVNDWETYALWAGGLGLVALALWKREAIVKTVADVVGRGDRLTTAPAGGDGVVRIAPEVLARTAGIILGRPITQEAYDLARMARSEGIAAGDIRIHVALNDAAELGWSVHRVLTFATNSQSDGWFGEQFTPAARAPGGIKAVRRYSTARDPYTADVLLAERVLFERQGGADPTGGAVKFVDKSSMGVQEGSGSFADLVARWAADGLRPFNLPGQSDDLVVFRRA